MENSPSDPRKRAHSSNPLSNSPPLKIAGLKMVDLSLTDTSSDGLLDKTYTKPDECQRLLDSDRRIVQELQEAWDEKSFARIRRLEIFIIE
ncbi:hypothetical protein K439DRAFT_246068 [Ramaria rubella]|nr:hypothetical protein K439DRAFT_246068 [Ramaria rubella]